MRLSKDSGKLKLNEIDLEKLTRQQKPSKQYEFRQVGLISRISDLTSTYNELGNLISTGGSDGNCLEVAETFDERENVQQVKPVCGMTRTAIKQKIK